MNITKLNTTTRLSHAYKEARNVNTSLASTMHNVSVRSRTFRSVICNTDLAKKVGGRNKLLNCCTFKIISKDDRRKHDPKRLLAKVLYCLHKTRNLSPTIGRPSKCSKGNYHFNSSQCMANDAWAFYIHRFSLHVFPNYLQCCNTSETWTAPSPKFLFPTEEKNVLSSLGRVRNLIGKYLNKKTLPARCRREARSGNNGLAPKPPYEIIFNGGPVKIEKKVNGQNRERN